MTREQNDEQIRKWTDVAQTCDATGVQNCAQTVRALAGIEEAWVENETKKIEVEAQKEVAKKQRIIDIIKTAVTLLIGLFTGWVALKNTSDVINAEHDKDNPIIVKSKAFGGIKLPNINAPKL